MPRPTDIPLETRRDSLDCRSTAPLFKMSNGDEIYKYTLLSSSVLIKKAFLSAICDQGGAMCQLGDTFVPKSIEMDSGKTIKLQIWGLINQHLTVSRLGNYIRGTAAIVILVDTSEADTLQHLQQDIERFKPAADAGTQIAVIAVSSNDSKPVLPVETVREFASANACHFVDCNLTDKASLNKKFTVLSCEITKLVKKQDGVDVSPFARLDTLR